MADTGPPRATSEAPAGRMQSRVARLPFGAALALVATVGFTARLAYVIATRNWIVGGDGLSYDEAAREVADGFGFINSFAHVVNGAIMPSALHPPAWTLTLAGPTALGLRSTLSHQVIACAVGALTIVVVGLAGREIASPRVGVIAATLTALYPNIWIYERELAAETLTMLFAALLLLCAYRFRRRPGTGAAVAVGATLGLVALSRAEQLLLGAVLVLPLILSARSYAMKQRLVWLGASLLTAVVLIAPWAVYNTRRFHEPVVLSTGLGLAMRQGDCGPVFHGRLLGYYTFACIIQDKVSPNDAVADSQYRHKALDFTRDNLSRVPVVLAAREARTFGFFRPAQEMHLDSDRGTHVWLIRVGFVAYWFLLIPAVAGFVALRRRRVPVYPLLALPLTVVVSVALTMGQTRYRAPAEVTLVLLAAVGFDAALARLRRPAARDRVDRTLKRRDPVRPGQTTAPRDPAHRSI